MESIAFARFLGTNRLIKLCDQAIMILSQTNASPLPFLINDITELVEDLFVFEGREIPSRVEAKIRAVNKLAERRGFRYRINLD